MNARKIQAVFDKKWFKICLGALAAALMVTVIGLWRTGQSFTTQVTFGSETRQVQVSLKYRNLDAWTGFRTLSGQVEIYWEPEETRPTAKYMIQGPIWQGTQVENMPMPSHVDVMGYNPSGRYSEIGALFFSDRMQEVALVTPQVEFFRSEETLADAAKTYKAHFFTEKVSKIQ